MLFLVFMFLLSVGSFPSSSSSAVPVTGYMY